jgi:hypothetical protein
MKTSILSKKHFAILMAAAAIIPLFLSADVSAAVNRLPRNVPEQNTRNRCTLYGGTQTGRLGAIWISNSSNYYLSRVDVSGTATTATVYIRGSAMNCITSETGTVYASSITSASPNASALTNIQSTVLNRGSTTSTNNGWWTSQGSQIAATLNLGTLAPPNTTSNPVTYNFNIGIYRCFGPSGNTGDPNQCAVESVPVTVVREGLPDVRIQARREPTGGLSNADVQGLNIRVRQPSNGSNYNQLNANQSADGLRVDFRNIPYGNVRLTTSLARGNTLPGYEYQVRYRWGLCPTSGTCTYNDHATSSWSAWTNDGFDRSTFTTSELPAGRRMVVRIQYRPIYAALCTGETVEDPVKVGATFGSTATFRNTGSASWPAGGRITARASHDGTTWRTGTVGSTSAGQLRTVSFSNLPAVTNLNQRSVIMELRLDNRVLDSCTAPFNPYVEFRLSPTVNGSLTGLAPDAENPNRYDFAGNVDVQYFDDNNVPGPIQPTINGISTTGIVRRNAVQFGTTESYPGNSWPKTLEQRSKTITSTDAGDEYCVTFAVNIGSGWVNRLGAVIEPGGGVTSDASCETVMNRPYFRAYGGNVRAGWNFRDSSGNCSINGSARILGWNQGTSSSPNGAGAGTQLAAMALNSINGFVSAAGRTAQPTPLKGLTFANTPAGAYGGNLASSAMDCMPDYFAGMVGVTDSIPGGSPITAFNASTWTNGSYRHVGNLSIASAGGGIGNVPVQAGTNARHITVYVEGDVSIRSPIRFGNYNSLAGMPTLRIIARNIYIHPRVQDISGILIAQPDGAGNGGNIITCSGADSANWFSSASATQLNSADADSGCMQPLTIYGSLIGRNVYLLRTYGTISDATSDETYNALTAQAAERVIYSPELWLRPFGASSDGGYESFTAMPPIL